VLSLVLASPDADNDDYPRTPGGGSWSVRPARICFEARPGQIQPRHHPERDTFAAILVAEGAAGRSAWTFASAGTLWGVHPGLLKRFKAVGRKRPIRISPAVHFSWVVADRRRSRDELDQGFFRVWRDGVACTARSMGGNALNGMLGSESGGAGRGRRARAQRISRPSDPPMVTRAPGSERVDLEIYRLASGHRLECGRRGGSRRMVAGMGKPKTCGGRCAAARVDNQKRISTLTSSARLHAAPVLTAGTRAA